MAFITDLTADRPDLIAQAGALLHGAFRGRSHDWQDLESARREAIDSLQDDKISRLALDDDGRVVGWIGAIRSYDGRVWEIHPLVVAASHRRRGIGRLLVQDLDGQVRRLGGLTPIAGSDDENMDPGSPTFSSRSAWPNRST